MRLAGTALLLAFVPFGLAVACGTRTGLSDLSDGATDPQSDAPASDARPTTTVTAVYCVPTVAPATTVTCSPWSECVIPPGGGIRPVCAAHTGTWNCGPVHCGIGCKCLDTEYGACTCGP